MTKASGQGPQAAGVVFAQGFQDGAEIHESVLTLLALDRAGCEIKCYAPDASQARVVNHLTGEETGDGNENGPRKNVPVSRST